MYYKLEGELKRLAFEWLDEYKEWHKRVKAVLKGFGASDRQYFSQGHPLFGYYVGGVVSESEMPRGWRKIKEYENGWVPDKRLKEGKRLQAEIKALGFEPIGSAVFNEIGIKIPIQVGCSYVTPGVAISAKGDYAVIRWDEDWPEISHCDMIEITTADYKKLTQL
jgi:hypothetical protein